MCDNKVLVCRGTTKTGMFSFVPPKKSLLLWAPQYLRAGARETSMATANLKKKIKCLIPIEKSKEQFISNNIYYFPTVCQAEHI